MGKKQYMLHKKKQKHLIYIVDVATEVTTLIYCWK